MMGLILVVLVSAFLNTGPWPCPADAADGSTRLTTGRLYYFWSFSVPEESLRAVFVNGEKIGLVAVLRGLPEGSAKESLLRLKRLLGERKVEVVIDPLLFRLYGITAVPAVIYAEGVNSSCEHCEPVPRYWKAIGDVSLEAALENLARAAPPVERYLQKLREGFYSR
jgi:conjugal transfer pilus assembly protein TrbC